MPCEVTCSHANVSCVTRAYVPRERVVRAYVLTCQRALSAYVFTCKRILRAYALTYQRALRAYVLMCHRVLRAHVPKCFAYLHVLGKCKMYIGIEFIPRLVVFFHFHQL